MKRNKNQKTKIQFENGTISSIEILEVNENPQKFIEEQTGLILGDGSVFGQFYGIITAWKSRHSPTDQNTGQFIAAAGLALAKRMSEEIGGYVAFAKESGEGFLYVPQNLGHYVFAVSKWIDEAMFKDNVSLEDKILQVKTIGRQIE
jgi:hypothetical protein